MLDDEFFLTVSGEKVEVRESGTEYMQLVAVILSDETQGTPIEAYLLPQEAMILAEKLIRFANAAIRQQPSFNLETLLPNG